MKRIILALLLTFPILCFGQNYTPSSAYGDLFVRIKTGVFTIKVVTNLNANTGNQDSIGTLILYANPSTHDTSLYMLRHSGWSKILDSTSNATILVKKIDTTQRGTANGVATLDGSTKVPLAQLPYTAGTGISITSGVIASTGSGTPSNLALGTATTTTIPITNSNGTGVTILAASSTAAGAMVASDKVALDSTQYKFIKNTTVAQTASLNISGTGQIGRLSVGASPNSTIGINCSVTLTGSSSGTEISAAPIINSDVISTANIYEAVPTTQATTFTLANLTLYRAAQNAFGAGSSVSTQRGFWVQSTLVGAASNFGFVGDIPNAANRWNIFMSGTAPNYYAGKSGFGLNSPTEMIDVSGNIKATGSCTVGTIVKSGGTSAQYLMADGSVVTAKTISGGATVTGNAVTTTFTITHSFGSTGYEVSISPTDLLAAAPYYVTNKTSTTFDIVYTAAPAAGSVTFDWMVHKN